MLENNSGESELRAFINDVLGHYHELFQMKAVAVKENVFFIMHGLWRTPTESFSQWLRGPRPSQLLQILMAKVEPLVDAQHTSALTLEHSCRLAEDALGIGMEKFQHTLACIDLTGAGSENAQAKLAVDTLEELEDFLNQADHLQHQVLHQMARILTAHQAARGLLALAEHSQCLRALNSLVTRIQAGAGHHVVNW